MLSIYFQTTSPRSCLDHVIFLFEYFILHTQFLNDLECFRNDYCFKTIWEMITIASFITLMYHNIVILYTNNNIM